MNKNNASLPATGSFPYVGRAWRADGHADTITAQLHGRHGHLDLATLSNDVDLQFLALYLEEEGDPLVAATECARYFKAYQELLASQPSPCLPLLYRDDLAHIGDGHTGIVLAMENCAPLATDDEAVYRYYQQGFRSFGLVWNHENALAGGALVDGGLKPQGRDILRRMDNLPVIVDLAHCNEESFYDVLSLISHAPLVSHSCCHRLHPHPRNLKDAQMNALADSGGLLGITFARSFLAEETAATIETILDHLCHAVSVMGVEHVCFGSDFDGTDLPAPMTGVKDMIALEEGMRRRGLSAREIALIRGENLGRFLWQHLEDS